MLTLLALALALGGTGLALLLPRPSVPNVRWIGWTLVAACGAGLVATGLVPIMPAVFPREPEGAVVGADWWLTGGLGIVATTFAAIAVASTDAMLVVRSRLVVAVAVAALVGIAVGPIVGVVCGVIGLGIALRIPAAVLGGTVIASEPWLPCVSGALVTLGLLMLVEARVARASEVVSEPAWSTHPMVVMGAVLLLVVLAFLGLDDRRASVDPDGEG